VGQESSARNSGVIHAGLYYPSGSLKALTCVEGRERLYARCAREELPHRRCGKLVVATNEAERGKLEAIHAQGTRNDAGALRMIDAAELRALEPRVRAIAALWSPETGIVDQHELISSYKREALAHGAELSLHTEVLGIDPAPTGLTLTTRAGSAGHGQSGAQLDELSRITASWVINSAGLRADAIAGLAGLDLDALRYRLYPCKGDYFELASSLRGMVEHLIYPMPEQAGLGVHVTLDLSGALRAGPDAHYVPEPFYDVDPGKAAHFAAAVQRYLPDVRVEHFSPGYAGVRPKLAGPGEPFRDFVIEEASAHGAPRLINLIGIESPGLTASEAIAERVHALIA
ncbi:MAG TPA: NAD(P)/FAD-dependent oxidoreductase, partial [Polyangiales bacterium]|nr:NAD(P)/FAD-dependent oxidoreductase [Polyangiales bacterium]